MDYEANDSRQGSRRSITPTPTATAAARNKRRKLESSPSTASAQPSSSKAAVTRASSKSTRILRSNASQGNATDDSTESSTDNGSLTGSAYAEDDEDLERQSAPPVATMAPLRWEIVTAGHKTPTAAHGNEVTILYKFLVDNNVIGRAKKQKFAIGDGSFALQNAEIFYDTTPGQVRHVFVPVEMARQVDSVRDHVQETSTVLLEFTVLAVTTTTSH
ncbi:hypothetical protein K523DRAFT_318084 [Schizophyllum commune Tattone D]|nr:hypothetical protein K523DRAFT_318084 [Schizophyllum commune Tattone D]